MVARLVARRALATSVGGEALLLLWLLCESWGGGQTRGVCLFEGSFSPNFQLSPKYKKISKNNGLKKVQSIQLSKNLCRTVGINKVGMICGVLKKWNKKAIETKKKVVKPNMQTVDITGPIKSSTKNGHFLLFQPFQVISSHFQPCPAISSYFQSIPGIFSSCQTH